MNWVSTTLSFGMIGFFLPLSIFLQSALGFTAFKAGLTFLPMSLISMVVAPFAGRMADRYDGRWMVAIGLTGFALGLAYVDWQASIDSDFVTFLPGTVLAGLGMGCTFAPLATVAMRNVRPRMAGAASGVLNTVRQLGGAIGSAVVGAVLQNQLATHLRDQAVHYSVQLPPQFRTAFVDAFANAARGGLDVGRGQSGASIPTGSLPPQVSRQLAELAHATFANGFIGAMRVTLVVPVAVLVLGALSSIVSGSRVRARQKAAARTAEAEAANTAAAARLQESLRR